MTTTETGPGWVEITYTAEELREERAAMCAEFGHTVEGVLVLLELGFYPGSMLRLRMWQYAYMLEDGTRDRIRSAGCTCDRCMSFPA